jgi:aconitate hydratase 2/2-methylisocitrate dehydratase
VSYYRGEKKVDLGFVGSCMVHKGDMKIVAQMLKNLEKANGKVEFKAPLVVAAPTYNIIDELKAEGDWDVLQKYSGFEFDDAAPKTTARTEYENILYLERPGCNLCMGNQEKAAKGDTVMATSTRLFQGRVVEDSSEKEGRVPARLDPGGGSVRHPWAGRRPSTSTRPPWKASTSPSSLVICRISSGVFATVPLVGR